MSGYIKSILGILSISLILFLIVAIASASTQIDEPQIAFQYSQADATRNLGLLIGTPINVINGFAYGDWQSVNDDGEILAENSTLYIEGGFPILGIDLQGYIKGLKDEGRVIGWQKDSGYFLRAPDISIGGTKVNIGAGNFATSRDT